jgi:SAM-dependent methyltransferase
MTWRLAPGVTKVHVFAAVLQRAEGRLLDLGCGYGGAMRHASDRLSVVGLDLSPEYCREARTAGEATVRGDLAHPLPFRSASFDLALCCDTFEHLLDPLALVGEIHRVLRPHGALLCHVPNEFSCASLRQILRGGGIRNRRFFPEADEWDYPHVRFFSHGGFRRMLERGGFALDQDLTDFGRGWRRRLYPLFGSGPSFVARRVG